MTATPDIISSGLDDIIIDEKSTLPDGIYTIQKGIGRDEIPAMPEKPKPFVSPLTLVRRDLGFNLRNCKSKADKRGLKSTAQLVLRMGVEREALEKSHPDYAIALAIQPSRKGWAWERKTGAPLQFSDPSQTGALIGWASRQSWWNEQLPSSPLTAASQYAEIVLDCAERGASRYDTARTVRDFVVAVLKLRKESNVPAEAVVG